MNPDLDSRDRSAVRLALSIGDPAGIGPEVILKALAAPALGHLRSGQIHSAAGPIEPVIFGSRSLLEATYDRLRSPTNPQAPPLADPADLDIRDVPIDPATIAAIVPGQASTAAGAAGFAYIAAAIEATLAGEFGGIVTGPIAKATWQAAGHAYPGQTELLAERAGVDRFGMLFVGRSPHSGWILRCLLATTHIPLAQVPIALTADLLSQKLDLLVTCLQREFGLDQPHIAIAGLNPHSGEQGNLGREELDWLQPWLDRERVDRPHVRLTGLVPPDTLWVPAGRAWFTPDQPSGTEALPKTQAKTLPDAYLALYHDQGLIPVKLMAFDCAVNTTIGLPFVRTSPDHGTAFDIAGLGRADPSSMIAAIEWAAYLVRSRSGQPEPSLT